MSQHWQDRDDLDAIRRWNFEADDRGLRICRGEHGKGEPCQFETASPVFTLSLIEQPRAQALRFGHRNSEVNP